MPRASSSVVDVAVGASEDRLLVVDWTALLMQGEFGRLVVACQFVVDSRDCRTLRVLVDMVPRLHFIFVVVSDVAQDGWWVEGEIEGQ